MNLKSKEKQNLNKKEEKRELLKPKNDIVFQSLFNQKNETITKNMISALLEENVTSIKINADKELLREYPEDKLGILDLEAEVNEKEKIDIEVQLVDRKDLPERLLRYFSKLYTLQIGKNYKEAKRVVIIAIIDYKFELTRELKQMETIWNLREKINPKLMLTDKIEIRIIELSKVKGEYNKNRNNEKAQWMLFINDPNDREVLQVMKENKEIKEATEEVRKMSEDEKLRRLAYLREKAILDETSIYDAGVDKGIEKEKRKVVQKMLEENIDIETIERIVGITKKEIEKIQKNIEKI